MTDTQENVETADISVLSQWQLIRLRFEKHKVAMYSLWVLCVLYFVALFAEFFAPYAQDAQDLQHKYCPPQPILFNFQDGLHTRLFESKLDPVTYRLVYKEHKDKTVPLGFFVKGEPTKIWGVIPMERRFFGVDRKAYQEQEYDENTITTSPTFYFLGADKYGQDIASRLIYGSRVSLSIGLISISITFVLGLVIGGISGYVGGSVDNFIQRGIEIINAFPELPLWLALGAALPLDWPALRVYFAITIVLSLLNWTGLARVARGKMLAFREEDYATAARLLGAGHGRILFRHLMPGMTSHIIVAMTLSIPGMILGETALSFLGLGLRPPVVSWGVMLQDCMNVQLVTDYPWILMPLLMIVVTVMAFNFLGDGMRDAADPYAAK